MNTLSSLSVSIRVIRGQLTLRFLAQERANQLPADENKNSSRECQNAHYDGRNGDRWDQRRDANEDEINREQEQTEIFLEVHNGVLVKCSCSILHRRGRNVTMKNVPN